MQYSIVIPVYNSSKTLPVLLDELHTVMNRIGESYELIFVDDCSPDNSWEVLKDLRKTSEHMRIIRLANNVGQWMATLAGIKHSGGQWIITIDDDLEYDTNDIELLIRTFQSRTDYLVYGIPLEKKNKNLSYKLFFRIRDRFLRIFFDKIQTESFKIFKREICFDAKGEMMSHLHFEAYTKFTLSPRFISYVPVNYRKRYFGNSNHTLYMKARLLIKYGIEYYRSPFRYPLYLSFLLILAYFILLYLQAGRIYLLLTKAAISMLFLLMVGISGKYLSSLYFKLKGLPEYVVIEAL